MGYACVGLDNAKTNTNVGSALRAAGLFGAGFVAVSGRRYTRSSTDTAQVYRNIPLLQVECLYSVIPYDCVPVAIELTPEAEDLTTYEHPPRAFYVFGAEDATLGRRVLSWCRDVVKIPTNGCLNLAACVNVVLYDRMIKMRSDSSPEKVGE